MNVFNFIKDLFIYKDLRKRLIVVLSLLILTRVLANIPLPDVNIERFKSLFESNQFLGFINIFSGGALSNFSVALLGLGPYITAVIILQLLTLIYPNLKHMYYEEGELGRAKFNQYARLLTIPLSIIQSIGFLNFLSSQGIINLSFITLIKESIIVTCGVIILMWIGELISEKKLGNGISLIIFSGIISQFPQTISQLYYNFSFQNLQNYIIFLILAFLIITSVVFINEAERRIPLVFAKRIKGMRMYGGATSYLPLRFVQAGVIPIIFAIAILLLPQTILNFLSLIKINQLNFISNYINSFLNNTLIFGFLYFILVFIFTYIYTGITFNPEEVSKNLQISGAFIPGIRPGKETEKYLKNIVFRLTFFGGLFLGIIAILPYIMQYVTKTNFLAIGGTSVLIMVSVTIETIKQIKSEISLRKYE